MSEDEAREILAECVHEHAYCRSRYHLAAKIKAGPFGQLSNSDSSIVAKAYWHNLRSMGVMDFDLLLHYLLRAVQEPGTSAAQFEHLAVDECQDCSELDAEIYLSMPIRSKFFVGDPNQQIMSFRGGNNALFSKLLAESNS